jgi:DNA gyrase inhibitor GyrI
MKKVLIVLGVLVVIIAAGVLYYCSYIGMFTKVNITEQQMGPFYFVYTPYTGDYSKVGPSMEKVRARLESEFGIKPMRAMGIYYSDPRTVKIEDLKADVGYLLDKSYETLADSIMKKMWVKIMFPKNYAVAEFPMKNKASIMMGIMKVYPEITKYMQSKGYKPVPAIEIYEKDKIIYAFEIKQ